MKQIMVLLLAAFIAVGCSKEKDELKARLTAKFEKDQDIADYKVDPSTMADCVSDKISKEAPGFPGSPSHSKVLGAYAKLVQVDPLEDFRPALGETKEIFGSTKKAYQAATNITNHVMSCMGNIMGVDT